MSWVFASLHSAVGLAFVGAVVGDYLGLSQGVGYLILQAEGTFDINTVFAGIIVLTAFALVLDAVAGVVERRLMTWQPKASETEKCSTCRHPERSEGSRASFKDVLWNWREVLRFAQDDRGAAATFR